MKRKLYLVALAALLFIGLSPTSSFAQIGISIGIAPPAIPIYTQPYPPGPGYIWTPGYWAYNSGYYWVPGAWVLPPRIGFLWTPGYWAYNGSNYYFNQGYWGPTVGFYGGINYGWGYTGRGYYGGRWMGNSFQYNRAVTRVNTTVVHDSYVNTNVVRNTRSTASFNGPGGTTAKATAQEETAAKGEHISPTSAQQSRLEAAKNNPDLHVANNQGKPKADAIKTFDRNNEVQANTGKGKGDAGREAGNSGFGQKQENVVNAMTPATSSKNNTYGKKQSTEAEASHNEKASSSNTRTERKQSKSHTNDMSSSHRNSQQSKVKSHQPPPGSVQQGRPGSGAHGKGQTEQSGKKKKKSENQGRGGGY